MVIRRLAWFVFPSLLLFCAGTARGADCTNPTAFSDVLVGGEARTGAVSPSSSPPNAYCQWYRVRNLAADRSYSLYLDAGASSATTITPHATLFQGTPSGPVLSTSEGGAFLRRYGWIVNASTAGTVLIRLDLQPGFPLQDYTYRLRVVETTMWCAWWFTGGDYNAFTLIKGLESAGNAIFIWRDLAGNEVGRTDTGIGRDNGFFVNARDWVSPGTTMGTMEIIHLGTLDSITAVTTTLSATTGLSFDAPFTRRPIY